MRQFNGSQTKNLWTEIFETCDLTSSSSYWSINIHRLIGSLQPTCSSPFHAVHSWVLSWVYLISVIRARLSSIIVLSSLKFWYCMAGIVFFFYCFFHCFALGWDRYDYEPNMQTRGYNLTYYNAESEIWGEWQIFRFEMVVATSHLISSTN